MYRFAVLCIKHGPNTAKDLTLSVALWQKHSGIVKDFLSLAKLLMSLQKASSLSQIL